MNYRLTQYVTSICTGLLLVLFLPFAVAASPHLNVETEQTINTHGWAKWILEQVQALPSMQAIDQGTLVAHEQRNALQQPLFNPGINSFYTDKTDAEYGVIVVQTIDLFDKRSANSKLGQVNYELNELDKMLQTEKKLSDAVLAYIEYATALQLLDVSRQQETLLNKMSSDLQLRQKVGDVSQIDAEMTYLSLSQNLQQISLTEVRYRKALGALNKTMNSQVLPFSPSLKIWNNNLDNLLQQDYINRALQIQYAQKQLDQSMAQSRISRLNKKLNPTVGLGAGRDGRENTVLFELSIPLNIRNDFSAEYRASLNKVTQSELELNEEKRLIENEIRLSLENYMELKKRVSVWKKLTSNRLADSQSILQRQWKSGDISTSAYLFSLQQRTASLISNIELTGEMQKTWVEWLLATSQVQAWLQNL